MEFSKSTLSLWAKKSRREYTQWLPLVVHMQDCANVANFLWNHWIPQQLKTTLAASIFQHERFNFLSEEEDLQLLSILQFLAAAHDIGKATPVFQIKTAHYTPNELDSHIFDDLCDAGLFELDTSVTNFPEMRKVPHATASQALLAQRALHKNYAAVVGAHHGKPSSRENYRNVIPEAYPKYFALPTLKGEWLKAQDELFHYTLQLGNIALITDLPTPNKQGQALLSGLLIMIDWIASNEYFFPYIDVNYSRQKLSSDFLSDTKRINMAIQRFHATTPWEPVQDWKNPEIFNIRFGAKDTIFEARPMQKSVWQVASATRRPGLMVIEAPMGNGKTEAALVAAEVFAEKCGAAGVYFALPTQATTDGIFPRIKNWIHQLQTDNQQSIILAHSKAQFNDDYIGLFNGDANLEPIDSGESDTSNLIVHKWFQGNKKSLLADFVVGTIDQLLMMALKQKHVMLRHVGLAGKVVIIDECHAYDAYMSQYLERTLNWLGNYGVPVVLLSATLPAVTRRQLVLAYLGKEQLQPTTNINDSQQTALREEWAVSNNYPLITFTDGADINCASVDVSLMKTIRIKQITEKELIYQIQAAVEDGGCLGIIVNTVKRAQWLSEELENSFGEDVVRTIHSQFIATDRMLKEKELRRELGPQDKHHDHRPRFRIIVGTQVLEQSLDIDFDLLITDLCPMDLLLQRMGRLHRFNQTKRPNRLTHPECWVLSAPEGLEFEPGGKAIYGAFLLQRTRIFVPEEVVLPKDIPVLVEKVYDESFKPDPLPENYEKNKQDHIKHTHRLRSKADNYRLSKPDNKLNANILSWLDVYLTDSAGEAAVRDSTPSIEVIILFTTDDEDIYYFEDKLNNIHFINRHQTPDEETARLLAQHQLRLPHAFCHEKIIEQTLNKLENIRTSYFGKLLESSWLLDELFLPLAKDQNNTKTELLGFNLVYTKKKGLSHEKGTKV